MRGLSCHGGWDLYVVSCLEVDGLSVKKEDRAEHCTIGKLFMKLNARTKEEERIYCLQGEFPLSTRGGQTRSADELK